MYVAITGGPGDIPAKVLKLFAYFLAPSLTFPYEVFCTKEYYHLIGKKLKLFWQLKKMILSAPKLQTFIIDKHVFKMLEHITYVYALQP